MASPVENPTDKDISKEKEYWNQFYNNVSTIPAVPSQFCVLVSTEVDRSTPIIEYGCGNGRDSLYFTSQGFTVLASDLSKDAIDSNQEKVGNGAKFSVCDVTDEAGVSDLISKAHAVNTNIVVYNRFFIHSIDETQERTFIGILAKSMTEGDKLYMEFRCDKDEALDKVYGKGHYRRYVKTEDLIKFMKSVGFEIEYEMTGQGMAKYKS